MTSSVGEPAWPARLACGRYGAAAAAGAHHRDPGADLLEIAADGMPRSAAMPALGRVVDPLGVLPALTRAGLTLLERLLATEAAAQAAELILRSPPARRAVRAAIEDVAIELLDDPAVARVVDRTLESPQLTELVARALESEGLERIVAQVLDSRLLDASVARLLEGEPLWIVVEEVARSPAVTEAIAHQGAGFADQMAEEVGRRTRRADARLERAARRLLRRRLPPDAGAGGVAVPPPAP